ncbi:MAG: hypothetical protein ACI934_001621 [Pseudohongiellaceae bacterium]|jgi:hypothetical protein
MQLILLSRTANHRITHANKTGLPLMSQSSPIMRSLRLLACFLCLVSLNVSAQKPTWIPVAELLLGSMGSADANKMAEVMNRCTALNMTLSALTAQDSPDVSQGYENQALQLIQNGIMIEMNTEKMRTGIEPDIETLSGLAVDAVKQMLSVYNQWLEDNYQDSGSYFNNDLEIEMKGCELATKFVLQMAV